MAKLLTSSEALEAYEAYRKKYGLTPETITAETLRVHVHTGNISATKQYGRLLFDRKEVRRFAKENGAPGRRTDVALATEAFNRAVRRGTGVAAATKNLERARRAARHKRKVAAEKRAYREQVSQ